MSSKPWIGSRRGAFAAVVAVLWSSGAGPIPTVGRAEEPDADAGPLVADFMLSSARGDRVSLWSQPDATRATLVGVLDRRDADHRSHFDRLDRLARRRASEGLRILLIDPDPAQRWEPEPELDGLILLDDSTQVVVRRLGLARSSDVLIVDRELRQRHLGPSLGPGEAASAAHSSHLDALVAAVLHGTPPPEPATAAPPAGTVGTAHEARLTFDSPPPVVSFREQIAPLVHQHCAECHRDGGGAPMDLTCYDEAAGWAPMMAEVAASGRMPPWSADPRYGRFRNERRITDTEKELLRLFAAQGALEGPRERELPEAAPAPGDWTIGDPDLVVELPEPQQVPAEGVLPFRSAILRTHLPEDRFIQAIECRPTATQVVHHIVLFQVPTDVPDELAAEHSILFPDAVLGGYVPGAPASWYRPGYGRRLRKGARIVASLHYTPNGRPAVDRTRVAIRFTPGVPEHEVRGGLLANTSLDIPPGEANARFFAIEPIERPIDLLSFQVHMHARGRRFRYELVRGGGRRVLLDVNPFDWMWQHFYELEQPVRALPGDLLVGIATYDNSAANPRNPDPTARVVNGPQPSDEMMNGYFSFVEVAGVPSR